MPPNRKQQISAEAAIAILAFVEEESDDDSENDDLDELYGNGAYILFLLVMLYYKMLYIYIYIKSFCPKILEVEQNDVTDNAEIDNNNDTVVEEEAEGLVGTRGERLRRRLLTRNRLVSGTDEALTLTNYKDFGVLHKEKRFQSVAKYDNKNETKYWFTNQPPNSNTSRRASANIITGHQGVQPNAKNTPTIRDVFELFFTPLMIDFLIDLTNEKISKLNLPEEFDTRKYPFVKIVGAIEINAFLGLFLYRAMYKLNTLNVSQLFSNTYGPSVFGAAMSRNRFCFILRHFSFDDEDTRDERWKLDRFAAIREFFEDFNNQCMTCLAPGDYLSLDETLFPTRNQISFKQYNPSKPAKYGLLFKSINASRYPYTFISSPYSGKPTHEGGDYYVQGTENIVKHLVGRLEAKCSLKGRNISFDRLYTSLPLELYSYNKDITSIGTINTIRKGIPAEIKEMRTREPCLPSHILKNTVHFRCRLMSYQHLLARKMFYFLPRIILFPTLLKTTKKISWAYTSCMISPKVGLTL